MSFLSDVWQATFDPKTVLRTAVAFFASGMNPFVAAATFAAGVQGDRQLRKLRQRARQQYNDAQRDRYQMVSTSIETRKLVYGRRRVSGPILYRQSTGDKQQYLHLVIALAGHEIDAVETVYLGETALPAADPTTGMIMSGPYFAGRTETRLDTLTVSGGDAWSITPAIGAGESLSAVVGVVANYTDSDNRTASDPVGYTLTGGTVQGTAPASAPAVTIAVTYTVATGTPVVRVRTALGSSTQAAFSELVAESGGQWTAAHRCRGIALLYVRLEYNQDVFGQTGLPNISAVIRGRKVRDPRTGLTAWSDNWALCLADYLRDATYGLGASAAEVPDAEVIEAANVADELVPLDGAGATQRRYTVNGVIDSATPRRQVLDALVDSGAGSITWVQGRWLLRAGAWRAPALTITDGVLAGRAPSVQPWAPRTEAVNRITATYAAADAGYADVQAPPVVNALYQSQDGGLELAQELPLDFVTDGLRAQRLAKIELERGRQAMVVQIECNLAAYDVSPGDTVALTLARYGWVAKAFAVESRALDPVRMIVRLRLRETAAGVWDWAYGEATAVDLTPNTTLISPLQRPAPLAGLAAESGTAHLQLAADGAVITRAWLSWSASSDVFVQQGGRIELQWRPGSADAWTDAPSAAGDATGAYIGPLVDGGVIYVRARAVNSLRRASDWAVIEHQVVGKTAPPSDVAGITATAEAFGLRLTWAAVPDLDVTGYLLRTGGSTWDSAVPLDTVRATTYLWAVQASGSVRVWVKALDSSGHESATAASVLVTVTVPAAPAVSAVITGADELISWTTPAAMWAIDRYEVRQGASWAAGTPVASVKGLQLRRRVDYAGARTYWVAAVDAAGNVGTAGSVAMSITAPGAPTSRRQEVVDNNVLLYWSAPASGTLPVDRYEVRKGASWAAGTVIGSNAASTFTAIFEQAAGTYTYWIAAVDTAGNTGTAGSIVATVSQPPDYVLRTSNDSTFAGTKTNMVADGGDLFGPVNTTETWSTHYSSRAWSAPQDQVSAGYPVYLQPSLTTGSYDEQWDAGAVLPATTIVVTLDTTVITGSVSTSVQIYYKTAAGDPWTAAAAGATSVLASGFRYYRVVLSFSATAGANLIRVNSLNVRLSSKLKTDSGTGTVTDATNGLLVSFGQAFVDADTPVVQPTGTTPLIPVVDFADVPNPTTFRIYLYTLAGAKTTGSFSWTARGY